MHSRPQAQCPRLFPHQPRAEQHGYSPFGSHSTAFPSGKAVLNTLRVRDPAARGLALSGAAHGGGLLAISDEPEAFPYAALGMNLFGACAVCLVSVPAVAKLLKRVAGL